MKLEDVVGAILPGSPEERKARAHEIMREVKSNIVRLDACVGPHEFSPDPADTRPMFKHELCSKCAGRVESQAARWYRLGLEHGAVSP